MVKVYTCVINDRMYARLVYTGVVECALYTVLVYTIFLTI